MTPQHLTSDLRSLRVIVPAAGIGSRVGGGRPKQYLEIASHTLLDLTIGRLREALVDTPFHIALHPDDCWFRHTASAGIAHNHTYTGGDDRAESVRLGLALLADVAAPDDWVLVHDVARPCITSDDIHRLLSGLASHPVGGLLASPVADTLKQVDDQHQVTATADREGLWRAYTPQLFRFGLLHQALTEAKAAGAVITDEASAIERLGLRPQIVPGRSDNIKVTVPEDLVLAEWLLTRQSLNRGQP